MKTFYLIAAGIAILSLVACSDAKPDEAISKPGISKVHQSLVMPKDSLGNIIGNGTYVYDSVQWLKPTWGQAIHYGNKSGFTWQKIVGVFFLLVFAGILVILFMDKIEMGRGPALYMMACLIAFLGFFYGKPMQIKLNNTFEVPINDYQQAIMGEGTSQQFWEDRYLNNEMIGAPVK